MNASAGPIRILPLRADGSRGAAFAGGLLLAAGLAATGGVPAASAEDNGVGATPALGWSSWSFVRHVTPGISKQAVARNTAIEGTPYHADDIATTTPENNYNCGGMVGIDYSKPGAQQFINSWAKQFASWGVDYVKIDGVGTPDAQDVQAWSDALKRTGRPVHLELSNSLDIKNAATWAKYSNGWRTGGDIECYCGANGGSYPLTSWSSISGRFDQVADWAPYGGPGAFNDYDSLEVGNGADDGLTPDERETQMSLWSLASSPLILGTDLTHLDPTDLKLLENKSVIAVDQDAIDARRISDTTDAQVFAKTEKNGDVVVGLFNTGSGPRVVSASAASLGLGGARDYAVQDLWSHKTTESAGTIAAVVPSHGVALYRVHALKHVALGVAPGTTVALNGLATVTRSGPTTATEVFTDNGALPVTDVDLKLNAPSGVTVTPTSATRFAVVRSGGTVRTTFKVTVPPSDTLFATDAVNATTTYRYLPLTPARVSTSGTVTVDRPVAAPDKTFSSTTADFSQLGDQLGIRAQGADIYGSTNEYGAIYRKGAEHDGSTTTVKVDTQTNTDPWAKAGIMVRDDISDADGSPGYLILAETPGNGYALQWDSDGDGQLDSNQSLGTVTHPSWLKLVRNGTSYTGYYSTDDTTWKLVGTVTAPAATATQDVGVFATAHSAGSTSEADFQGFTTS